MVVEPTHLKNMSNSIISPSMSENNTYLSCHHLVRVYSPQRLPVTPPLSNTTTTWTESKGSLQRKSPPKSSDFWCKKRRGQGSKAAMFFWFKPWFMRMPFTTTILYDTQIRQTTKKRSKRHQIHCQSVGEVQIQINKSHVFHRGLKRGFTGGNTGGKLPPCSQLLRVGK